ncbi:integrase arm-type DNA-binding domain-containing protein [Qipengyuania gaetbuli]|uniref:tyrosine-type recombinase/integrase n=1 Tax=Qipengyuania gaetbuli TaxID=266952 RepID=UPI001C997244|nr:site-specific integrase [Qipengyuania gaetbuli]MBY6015182.1 integrase arm-type DNA-binding domain-containing protein [Qipengyuania gaetbuli]
MPKAALTKRTVDAAKSGERDQFIWDIDVAGFGLKVTPAGGKVYVFQYRMARPGEAARTAAKRYTIGKHGRLTADQARSRAKELAAMVEMGTDPRQAELDAFAALEAEKAAQAERVRLETELAFDRAADTWLEYYEHEKGRRPASVRQARLIVTNHLKPALGSKPMPHIDRSDLQPILDKVPAKQKAMKRAVFAYASILFGWAAKRGMINGNPLTAMERPSPPDARKRVLTDSELADTYRATQDCRTPFGAFFRLLILTGQRRSEVAGMEWSELDRASAVWTIPAERAKNKAAHIVPLSAPALEELDRLAGVEGQEKPNWPVSGFVLTTTGENAISGISKAKLVLDAAIEKTRAGEALAAWRIHDLRRTLATGLQRLGVRFEVTEAVLNHVSGAKSGVAGVYQQHDWKEEKRSALEAWARHVASIANPAHADNVTPLKVVA